MGLDMYLYANKYIYEKNVDQIKELAETNHLPNPRLSSSIHVRQLVGYWRKANAIHGEPSSGRSRGRESATRRSGSTSAPSRSPTGGRPR